MLKKENTLYERDETGELIPQEVLLEIGKDVKSLDKYRNETICIIPAPRGKLKKFFHKVSTADNDDNTDFDGELILGHCINPKYSEKEIIDIKPELATALVDTILRESGVPVHKAGKKKGLQQAEDDFAKNLEKSKPIEKKQI